MLSIDWVGALAVVIFSLFVFSYLLADDNAFFRMGAHLLVGISAGFLLAVMIKTVLVDQYLFSRILVPSPDWPLIVLILVFGLMLLARVLPGSPMVGNIPMAYLVGVGAAVVIGGAVSGTLVPQVLAATLPGLVLGRMPADPAGQGDWYWKLMELLIVLFVTVMTLAYFTFGARPRGGAVPEPPRVMKPFIWMGRVSLTITLGALYAGALLSSLTALAGRSYEFALAVVRVMQGLSS
jgi:hypothetical protein